MTTAESLYFSVAFNEPFTSGAKVDFGLDSQRHFEAMIEAIKEGDIELDDLKRVSGNGKAITELLKNCPNNPHKELTFETATDWMYE
ncbi:MAG: hypothetical protein ACOCUT_00070 [bacterium]